MNRYGVQAALVASILVLGGCGDATAGAEAQTAEAQGARSIAPERGTLVGVTASHSEGEHRFELSSREVPNGWVTIRFTNATPYDHFVLLYRAPQAAIDAADAAGTTLLEHWYETVTVPFQEEFEPYVGGEIGYDAFVGNLVGAISASAPWFFDPGAATMGGPGLTAAGGTSETTIHLEPGSYILECYVKDASEEFHSYNGMLEMLTVTDAASDAREPTPTARIAVSAEDGLAIPGNIRPGTHTFAIEFADQKAYEHLLGHSAHLVRLHDRDAEGPADLGAWMDWRQRGALAVRAPAGAEFLGGTPEMQAGRTAYFTVDLTPGEYAWIAAVPDPAGKDMLKTFTVPARGTR